MGARPRRPGGTGTILVVSSAVLALILRAVAGFPWSAALLLHLGILSLATFLIFGLDKSRARAGSRRVAEGTLLGAAAFGGGVGAWVGMRRFRHKTRHRRFAVLVPLFALAQVALLVLALVG